MAREGLQRSKHGALPTVWMCSCNACLGNAKRHFENVVWGAGAAASKAATWDRIACDDGAQHASSQARSFADAAVCLGAGAEGALGRRACIQGEALQAG